MSFETTNIAYDPTRKGGITQTFKATDGKNLEKFLCQFLITLDLN